MDIQPSDPAQGLVVLCAANNWDDITLADRPLAEALSAHTPILYVDPPLSHLTPRHNPRVAPALRRPRLRQVGPGLWRLTPVVTPFAFRSATVPITRALVRHQLQRALHRCGRPVDAMVTTWLDVDVFDLAPRARHVYWIQDDVASGAALWGLDADRIRAAEGRDLVLTASPKLAEDWAGAVRAVATMPNGCDPTRFAQGSRRSTVSIPDLGMPSDSPVAGFVGHLNARSDLRLLHAVADRRMTLLLVGPVSSDLGTAFDDLLRRSNVVAIGPQPFEELPQWLEIMRVGLLPYHLDEFNRGSFPLKTLEYLVAGLPVVSTPLPASKWLGSPDVVIAGDATAFADAAERLAGQPRNPADVRRRHRFALQHSWDARADQLLRLLSQTG